MKNVIITGASGSLGSVTVNKFIEDGHTVIATVSPGKVLDNSSRNLHVYPVDLINEKGSEKFVSEAVEKYRTIDAALLLVGGYAGGGITDTDITSIQKMIRLNFETAYNVARPVFKQMIQQKTGGRIVFIASKPALNPQAGKSAVAYALSKSMLVTLAQLLNAEGANRNVVASIVAPGIIDTAENRKYISGDNVKYVTTEEITRTLRFLISEDAKSLSEPVIKMFGN
jgi:NAD(P)-dependent dehydrogenase (short-subunit alcohol dehydrogenase family)